MSTKKSNTEKKPKFKLQSTQSFLPISDIKDGIIITKDRIYLKIIEITPINFTLRSLEEQINIIQSFGAVIRVLPITTQFKIVSRRADVSMFVDKIKADMETETEESCKNLQQEQIELITSVGAREGVSRRFFIIFQYEQPSGLQKSSEFSEIRAELETAVMHIQNLLLSCDNEVITFNTDKEIYEVLFYIFCKGESETKSFDEKMYEVLSKYLIDESYDPNRDSYIPSNDFIAPRSIDTRLSSKYVIIDGVYHSFCYIPSKSYSNNCRGGWLSLLVNLGEGIDVDLYLKKENIQTVSTKLAYALRFNKVKARGMEDTSTDYDDVAGAISSGYYIKRGIASGEDFCYMGIMVTITGNSEKELNWKVEQTKKFLLSQDLRLKTFQFQQEEAYLMNIPVCNINNKLFKKMRRNILSSDAASAYPFVSFEVNDENGYLMGKNKANNSLVFIDNFSKNYKNANMVILGTSGAGKTFTMQCIALRMRQKKTQVFILAPDKGWEFKRACEAIGGQYVKIAPGSKQNINIMEIRKHDSEINELLDGEVDISILADKIQQLHTFFSLLIKQMTDDERQYLDEAIVKTYERFGITHDNDSLISDEDPNKYKTMPTLGDLYETLLKNEEQTGHIVNMMKRYVMGSASSFNGHTNVNLDNQYVVLDISSLTDEMKSVGMFIALDYVWDKIKEDRTARKAIFLDELWTLIGSKASDEAANFVFKIFKTIRAIGGSAIAATQDLNDFFAKEDGKYGKGIINNAYTKFIMQLEPQEAQTVQDTLNLSDAEIQQTRRFGKGEGLLIANSNHILIEVKSSDMEYDMITTDKDDLKRIAKEKMEAARSKTE